jgi:hypothetical protein
LSSADFYQTTLGISSSNPYHSQSRAEQPIFHVCANILGKRQYFMILLDFVAANILCIFSVFIYAFLYAPIFLAQLF